MGHIYNNHIIGFQRPHSSHVGPHITIAFSAHTVLGTCWPTYITIISLASSTQTVLVTLKREKHHHHLTARTSSSDGSNHWQAAPLSCVSNLACSTKNYIVYHTMKCWHYLPLITKTVCGHFSRHALVIKWTQLLLIVHFYELLAAGGWKTYV